jgi:CRISPR-associated protein (TIGR02710 family)
MNEQIIQSMLISVGGAPAPIIKSIELNKPEKIIFFASRDSYKSVTEAILPEVAKSLDRIPQHEIVVTSDFQDVGESAFALLREVPVALEKLGINDKWPEYVDYTAGTKSMSAAVVWASSRFPCTFSYIGSESTESRTKGGLGIVLDGKERCLLLENPWNAVAYYDVRQAINIFNGGQYANAVIVLENIIDKVTAEHRKCFLTLLCGVWKGYAAWDKFDHRNANHEFGKNIKALLDLAPQEELLLPGTKLFAENSFECYETLKGLSKEKSALSWDKIYDLMANALRRADMENKFDDATARCYAAIEKYGKHALKLRHGIDNSRCRLDQLPEHLYKEYEKYKTFDNDYLQFGLQATFGLLATMGDDAGLRFTDIQDQLIKLLALRNNSILGHGNVPVKEDNFYSLFNLGLILMKLTKEELVQFPKF